MSDFVPMAIIAISITTGGLAVLFLVIRGIQEWHSNNAMPVEIRTVKAISRRTRVFGRGHTQYFITFEFSDGDRKEFNLRGEAFGLIAEGDWGDLMFQGTRFKGFVRKVGGV